MTGSAAPCPRARGSRRPPSARRSRARRRSRRRPARPRGTRPARPWSPAGRRRPACARSSSSSTRGRRTRSELTFQVTMRTVSSAWMDLSDSHHRRWHRMAPDKLHTYRAKRDFKRPGARRRDAARPRTARRGSSSRSTTPRACTGTCGSSTTASLASWAIPNGIPPDPREPAGGPHRGPPARVPRLPGRDPGRRVRRRDDDGSGTAAPTRSTSGSEQEGRGHLPRRAAARPLRAVPDRQRGRAAEKDWMIHRMDPPADPGASRCPSASCRCWRGAGELPRARGGLVVRGQVGRRARDRLRRAGPARLETRNLNEITDAYPEVRGSCATWACARRCSTARSSPSTRRGGRASSGCSGGCT